MSTIILCCLAFCCAFAQPQPELPTPLNDFRTTSTRSYNSRNENSIRKVVSSKKQRLQQVDQDYADAIARNRVYDKEWKERDNKLVKYRNDYRERTNKWVKKWVNTKVNGMWTEKKFGDRDNYSERTSKLTPQKIDVRKDANGPMNTPSAKPSPQLQRPTLSETYASFDSLLKAAGKKKSTNNSSTKSGKNQQNKTTNNKSSGNTHTSNTSSKSNSAKSSTTSSNKNVNGKTTNSNNKNLSSSNTLQSNSNTSGKTSTQNNGANKSSLTNSKSSPTTSSLKNTANNNFSNSANSAKSSQTTSSGDKSSSNSMSPQNASGNSNGKSSQNTSSSTSSKSNTSTNSSKNIVKNNLNNGSNNKDSQQSSKSISSKKAWDDAQKDLNSASNIINSAKSLKKQKDTSKKQTKKLQTKQSQAKTRRIIYKDNGPHAGQKLKKQSYIPFGSTVDAYTVPSKHQGSSNTESPLLKQIRSQEKQNKAYLDYQKKFFPYRRHAQTYERHKNNAPKHHYVVRKLSNRVNNRFRRNKRITKCVAKKHNPYDTYYHPEEDKKFNAFISDDSWKREMERKWKEFENKKINHKEHLDVEKDLKLIEMEEKKNLRSIKKRMQSAENHLAKRAALLRKALIDARMKNEKSLQAEMDKQAKLFAKRKLELKNEFKSVMSNEFKKLQAKYNPDHDVVSHHDLSKLKTLTKQVLSHLQTDDDQPVSLII
ncbi:hypothetical protein QTN25_009046 [Entamoeba marina]